MRITDYFKALSDETRLRSLALLLDQNELCVCELTEALELSQPKISRHLAQLRQTGILLDRREGQWVYYRLNTTLPNWAFDVLKAALDSPELETFYQQDLQRLNDMSNRPIASNCC